MAIIVVLAIVFGGGGDSDKSADDTASKATSQPEKTFRPENFGDSPTVEGLVTIYDRFHDGILNGDYIVLYDLGSKKYRQYLEETVDRILQNDTAGRLSSLKNLEGRTKVLKYFEKAKELGAKTGFTITEMQKEKWRSVEILKIVVFKGETKAKIWSESRYFSLCPEAMICIKEADGWRMDTTGRYWYEDIYFKMPN